MCFRGEQVRGGEPTGSAPFLQAELKRVARDLKLQVHKDATCVCVEREPRVVVVAAVVCGVWCTACVCGVVWCVWRVCVACVLYLNSLPSFVDVGQAVAEEVVAE
jgi:hypothetical protein